MKKSLATISLVTLALATPYAYSQGYGDNDTPRQTAAETAQLKAQAEAARAKWAAMTPAEKAAVRKNAQQKRWADLSALDRISDDDTEMLTPDQAARLKSQREAAQAKWAAMTPEQKAAMRKSASQMRLVDMTELDKIAGSGS
jgi:hypothetical protein